MNIDTVYIVCCNDSLEAAFFLESLANTFANDKQKEAAKSNRDWCEYWHVHAVLIEDDTQPEPVDHE